MPGVQTIVDFDTASAAQTLSRMDSKERAVIARHSADIYSLMVLDENIENDPYNMTRFLVFGKKPLEKSEEPQSYITSLLFQINHVPGSLINVLKAFSDNGINLTKLETYALLHFTLILAPRLTIQTCKKP